MWRHIINAICKNVEKFVSVVKPCETLKQNLVVLHTLFNHQKTEIIHFHIAKLLLKLPKKFANSTCKIKYKSKFEKRKTSWKPRVYESKTMLLIQPNILGFKDVFFFTICSTVLFSYTLSAGSGFTRLCTLPYIWKFSREKLGTTVFFTEY